MTPNENKISKKIQILKKKIAIEEFLNKQDVLFCPSGLWLPERDRLFPDEDRQRPSLPGLGAKMWPGGTVPA